MRAVHSPVFIFPSSNIIALLMHIFCTVCETVGSHYIPSSFTVVFTGAGLMVRGLPAEAVPVSATPSAVVTIPELSDGRDERDSTTWQQQVNSKLDL